MTLSRLQVTTQGLTCQEFLGDLTLELSAVGAVLGHGFHPLKAQQRRSIPNLQTVHRHGRIPIEAKSLAPFAHLSD